MQFASVWVRGFSPGAGRQGGFAFSEFFKRHEHNDPTTLKPQSLNALSPKSSKPERPEPSSPNALKP
eukprot:8552150-Alexandrium_andersonii.AAC.1